MDYRERVIRDPEIRFGKPVIKGIRITISDIMGHLAAGDSHQYVLEAFPQLTNEDLLACFAYLADREGIISVA